jgi:hypothetical protein
VSDNENGQIGGKVERDPYHFIDPDEHHPDTAQGILRQIIKAAVEAADSVGKTEAKAYNGTEQQHGAVEDRAPQQ